MHPINPPDLKTAPLYGSTIAILFGVHDLIGHAVIAFKKINNSDLPVYFNVPHHMAIIETDNHIVFAIAPMPCVAIEAKILTGIKIDDPFVDDALIDHILSESAGFQNTSCAWVKKHVILNNTQLLQTLTTRPAIKDAMLLLDEPASAELSKELKDSAQDYYDRCNIREILKNNKKGS